MALFTGTHVNKVDKKGRVSVPKPFRDAIEARGGRAIYAYRSPKFEAIEVCGEDFIERLSASVDDLDMFSDAQDTLANTILASAHELSFDGEGRIILPLDLADYAHITEQAAFVGRGKTFQIWEPEAARAAQEKARQRLRETGMTLRLRPEAEIRGSE